MTKGDILSLVLARIPSPPITGIDVDRADCSIEFNWYGSRFRVDENLRCDEVQGLMLAGGRSPYLISALLKLQP